MLNFNGEMRAFSPGFEYCIKIAVRTIDKIFSEVAAGSILIAIHYQASDIPVNGFLQQHTAKLTTAQYAENSIAFKRMHQRQVYVKVDCTHAAFDATSYFSPLN